MQVRDKYQEFAFRTNLTINLTLSLSLSLSLDICKYIYVGPFVILWGPFGLTTTVTLPTHHRTHLSFTRSVISLFNRFVTANPKGRSFNVNLLFVVKIYENFITSLTFTQFVFKKEKENPHLMIHIILSVPVQKLTLNPWD